MPILLPKDLPLLEREWLGGGATPLISSPALLFARPVMQGQVQVEQMKSGFKIPMNILVRRLLAGLAFALPLTACSEKSMDVAVYNYWPRAIMDVSVNGQYAGGSFGGYHPGGTGGKIVCCVNVKPGPISVEWTLDGPPKAPGNGTRIRATIVLDHISSGATVLTVHIYPDKTVFAETSAEYVDERPQPQSEKK